jgi:phenylacetate-CoA ligase
MRQRKLPFQSRERIERIRDRRIRGIVRYASRAVPFYRELFRKEGIDWRDIKGEKELIQLPIIDKRLVRCQPELFMSETLASRRALSFMTSGTTGSPMKIFHDRRSLCANIAFGERERMVPIMICGSVFRPKEVYVGSRPSTFTQVIDFYEQNVLFPVRPRRRFVSVLEPIEKIAEVINHECPDILVGYGGWVELFFKTVAARDIELRAPKMIMYIAEALPYGTREYIEKKFGIPVFSRYTAAECFKIGFYCEERTGFHIHEDLCHVRIIDGNGQRVQDGERGEVVMSNLINRAFVLLNYPMGDLAAFCANGDCRCGRHFRRITELEGRTEDILVLPNGQSLHPRAIWQIIKDEKAILQYQFIQHELERFTLDIVTAQKEDFESLRQRIADELRELLGRNAGIEIRYRTVIPRPPGRKFRAVASKITRSAWESDTKDIGSNPEEKL